MKKNEATTIVNSIQNRIYTIRGTQVMLDRDLAELYQVSTSRLNEQVKRNLERFPKEFKFQLTRKEFENLRSQFATSKLHGGRRYLPYVFTEQGVAMLSSVLNSKVAVKISIQIMQAFVHMRKFLIENANIFNRLDSVEQKQLNYQLKSDKRFEKLFKALEDKSLKPKQGIFYDGQIFDAYVFVADLIKSAKKSIILVDNFIDETVLQLFVKRKKGVKATIYTNKISQILKLDLKKHNQQYEPIKIHKFSKAHDRFLIIDQKFFYHFGASLKDLGKKWFAFSKLNIESVNILEKLKQDWFVYIVECKDGTYYTGISNDLNHRVEQHNLGKGAKYTRSRGPVSLVYCEKYSNHSIALKRECEIKKLTRSQKKDLANNYKE